MTNYYQALSTTIRNHPEMTPELLKEYEILSSNCDKDIRTIRDLESGNYRLAAGDTWFNIKVKLDGKLYTIMNPSFWDEECNDIHNSFIYNNHKEDEIFIKEHDKIYSPNAFIRGVYSKVNENIPEKFKIKDSLMLKRILTEVLSESIKKLETFKIANKLL